MVVAQNPPASRYQGRQIDWERVVSEIKALRGQEIEWANIGEFSPGIATHIRNGKYRYFLPEGWDDSDEAAKRYMADHWDITSRMVGQHPQRVLIYIRWMG